MARKKVEGSEYGEVEVDGLKEHRKGTDQGHGKKAESLEGDLPNIISKDLKPYPSEKKRADETIGEGYNKPPLRGDIPITESSDPGAIKKYRDEQ